MTPDLTAYDVILLNTSAGKDSQATIDVVYEMARDAGVRDRLVAVHSDLGRVEWADTRELAERQARHYGIRFEVVSRPHSKKCKCGTDHPNGDLLHQLEYERLKFPDRDRRWCTSDQKTSQVVKLLTRLVDEHWDHGWVREPDGSRSERKVQILNVLGIRADESPARAKYVPLSLDAAHWSKPPSKRKGTPGIPHGKREVHRWYPIFDWTVDDVWERIRQSGVEHHRAYDLGMPRLSCVFCVFASKSALTVAARHNPGLALEYARVEARIGHTFRKDLSMLEIIRAAGETETTTVEGWAA